MDYINTQFTVTPTLILKSNMTFQDVLDQIQSQLNSIQNSITPINNPNIILSTNFDNKLVISEKLPNNTLTLIDRSSKNIIVWERTKLNLVTTVVKS